MSTPPHHPCGASATGEREGNQADGSKELERGPASRMPRPLAGLADRAPPPGARTRPARGPCASRTALCLVTRCDTRGPYRAVPPRAKPSGRQAAMRALRELSSLAAKGVPIPGHGHHPRRPASASAAGCHVLPWPVRLCPLSPAFRKDEQRW
jgi:hypothetical protein